MNNNVNTKPDRPITIGERIIGLCGWSIYLGTSILVLYWLFMMVR